MRDIIEGFFATMREARRFGTRPLDDSEERAMWDALRRLNATTCQTIFQFPSHRWVGFCVLPPDHAGGCQPDIDEGAFIHQ